MGSFTDIFIKRPVLAWSLNFLLFFAGLKAIFELPIQEYPTMTNTAITVTTVYPGADADLIEGFITSAIEKSIASADGIDYLTSASQQNVSIITAYIKLNYNPDSAFTSILSKVQAALDKLPDQAEQPVLSKSTGQQIDLMYIAFNSSVMTAEQITEYIARVVVPKLQTISGISEAEVLGGSSYAMRIWLDPQLMAAKNITPSEVGNALLAKNFQAAAGTTKGNYISYNLSAKTDLHSPQEFNDIIVETKQGSHVYLRDIARAALGAETYNYSVYFNGDKGVFVGIKQTPGSNPLTIIDDVRKMLPDLIKQYPPGLHSWVVYDSTDYIRSSINKVLSTILEASLIIVVVIFLFMGSLRAVIIPIITIPLSLVGVCILIFWLGFSLNLLTLLAMVLAIGLVVDDAIVVMENVYRHIEEGQPPHKAALLGAREIVTPIIAMTITLAAVYAPIGLTRGITGALFKEFAFTLAMTVIISGMIALTLSPLLCSKILHAELYKGALSQHINNTFMRIRTRYQQLLRVTLGRRTEVLIFAAIVLISCFILFISTPSELAPQEDQGLAIVSATAPQYANINYLEKYSRQIDQIFKTMHATAFTFILNGQPYPTSVFAGQILKPWNQRTISLKENVEELNKKLDNVQGLQVSAFTLPPLPTGGSNIPVQFEIMTTADFKDLYSYSQQLLKVAKKSGLFTFVDNTLKYDLPKLSIKIDRKKAESLGVSMEEIGRALAISFGGNYVNYFSMEGRSYQVIPQVKQKFRYVPNDITQIYVKNAQNVSIPLSTFVTLKLSAQPNSLTHFQQLNSTGIEAVLRPNVTIDQGLRYLQAEAQKIFPRGYTFDYAGQSRQFIREGSALIGTFFFALVIIYLVLAAQFESFRMPFIILISVPMSICGALIPLYLGLATINIYTQVGLITLIGLISKHGILMTDFANQLRRKEGMDVFDAIEKAATIRLRPILMTTAAMVLGVLPLLAASGPGSVSRFDIGLVIAAGMLIGTIFTLFVVPNMYILFAKR